MAEMLRWEMPSAKRCIARSYSQKVRVRDERKVMSTET
jgi:hypothetical protein